MNSSPTPSRALHRCASITLALTIVLTVGLGGAVTSTETGMAYPTWPNINANSLFSFFYGSLTENFGVGASLEHTHRQAGALVGLLAIACVAVAARTQRHLTKYALIALALVTLQGLLGAFRVLGNTQMGAIIHAVGAQVVVVSMVVLVKYSNPSWRKVNATQAPTAELARLRLWSTLGVILLFFNLIAAASLRHKIGAFSGHLVLALTTSAVLLTAVFRAMRDFSDRPLLVRAARFISRTIGLQVGLGVATWAFLIGPLALDLDDEQTRFLVQTLLATSHLILGVVLMAASTNLNLETRRAPLST